ncbi:MAG: hypothetical protein Q8N94_04525 [Methanoregula sp.]|nr:hypothetical protein [Methanoregula sp.]
MDVLTVEQVIAFHKQVMKTDGGNDRLLSEANIHQMVFQSTVVRAFTDGLRLPFSPLLRTRRFAMATVAQHGLWLK